MFFFGVLSVLSFGALIDAAPVKLPQCPDYCKGTNSTNSTYICGDYRLGPVNLPTALPLSNSVYGYDRLGGHCPGEFIENWWNSSSNSFIYPPLGGFQPQVDGTALQGSIVLQPGALIDRFGSEYGAYFAPYGSPFEQRALPPSNLDSPPDQSYPYNYHVYEVLKNLTVLAGPIAPWFDQPGQGTQYETNSSVMQLLSSGYLRSVTLSELNAPGI